MLTRVVAFSGMYPFGDRDPIDDLTGVELLLLNGVGDPMAPAASVDVLERTATEHGATVTRIGRPGGHGIDGSEVQAAQEWVAR